MCGICGLLGSDAPDPGLVESMNAAIVHRGPDHGAVEAFGRCVLGYRRLAIVDLEQGDQPVASEDGGVVAVFNGEIYNFRELRRELEAAGHAIRGTGDSPVVPHAYEQWGETFAERLDGMFAIALWDRARERLLLVRDRLGKKPLLYARLPDGALAFASETKALLRLPQLPRELDLAQLDAFLALQYVPRSGLRAVEKVPPGSYLVAQHGAVRVRRYWEPAPSSSHHVTMVTREEEAVERVREEVRAAVRRRLVADVPLGALLSGGIDSSVVVAAMAAAQAEPVRTFTVGFPDERYDERRFARAVAERYGTRHEELEIDAAPDLERLASVLDEPLGDEAALPLLHVCEATRRHVKVALVGDGGDEVFGGYERYAAHALARRLPRPAAALLARGLRAWPGARREPRSAVRRGRGRPAAGAVRPARRGVPARPPPPPVDGRGARAAGGDPPTRRRRPAARRPHLVPAERPAAEGRPGVDGGLARVALALPRPPPGRARARAPARARARQAGAAAGVRRRPAARDRRPPQDRLRRAARPLVPRGAATPRRRPPPHGPGPRPLPPRRARAAARRARGRPRRPRPPPLVPLPARALAAPARRHARPDARRRLSPPRPASGFRPLRR